MRGEGCLGVGNDEGCCVEGNCPRLCQSAVGKSRGESQRMGEDK